MTDGLTLPKVWQSPGKIPFQRLFKAIPFKVVFEDDSIAKNTIYVGGGTVTVTGAKLGDFVFIAPEQDPVDKKFVAYVTAANTVTMMLSNNNGTTDTDFSAGAKVNGVVFSLKNEFWDQGNLA